MAQHREKLTIRQILVWADAHHKRKGEWPTKRSGPVHEAPTEKWSAIDGFLQRGSRGLPGSLSLAQRLSAARGPRKRKVLKPLTMKQVLAWIDEHHHRTGRWPTKRSGSVRGAPGERWEALDAALKKGNRGLPGGWSLAERLARDRQVRNTFGKPRLKIKQILTWTDAHHKRTGEWPALQSGQVHEAPDENWSALSQALDKGARGLASGGSLAKLLAKYGRKRNQGALPNLTDKQILAWADDHHERIGKWPTKRAGAVRAAPNENWMGIDRAMRIGYRGFAADGTLAGLLADRRGARHLLRLPPLTIRQILAWADVHHKRTGKWPTALAGPVSDRRGQPTGESWLTIEDALNKGRRGLAGCRTLPVLLARHRRNQHDSDSQRLTVRQVMLWADAYHERSGKWPIVRSGRIPGSGGETWRTVDSALRVGARWQTVGTTLAELLGRHRNEQHPKKLPRLTIKQVLNWANEHYQRTGRWPKAGSGRILGSCGETWSTVNSALAEGCRGFAQRSSLAQLLEKRHGVRNIQHLPRLTIKQILKWVDAHRNRTGQWPTPDSGAIPRSSGETWNGVQGALFSGLRGLRPGNTLAKVLDKYRGVRNSGDLPALRVHLILRWADAHRRRTGKLPRIHDGRVHGAPGEEWSAINVALLEGCRGLPQGSSLPRLLSKHRGYRNIHDLPRLSTKQILQWADAFRKREKGWPRRRSGRIPRTNGETWEAINYALKKGNRGLSGDWSLFRFLNRYRRPERGL